MLPALFENVVKHCYTIMLCEFTIVICLDRVILKASYPKIFILLLLLYSLLICKAVADTVSHQQSSFIQIPPGFLAVINS